jgi:hypothetical protein
MPSFSGLFVNQYKAFARFDCGFTDMNFASLYFGKNDFSNVL